MRDYAPNLIHSAVSSILKLIRFLSLREFHLVHKEVFEDYGLFSYSSPLFEYYPTTLYGLHAVCKIFL